MKKENYEKAKELQETIQDYKNRIAVLKRDGELVVVRDYTLSLLSATKVFPAFIGEFSLNKDEREVLIKHYEMLILKCEVEFQAL